MHIKALTNKLFIFLSLAVLLLSSCQNNSTDSADPINSARISSGGNAVYGGVLCVSEEESFRSIFPGKIEDATSAKIAGQIHDGLVNFNPKDLTIVPCIAKDWSINENHTEYTFYLRNNVYFHSDPCFAEDATRKVVANDFKYSFELLCNDDFEVSYNMFIHKIVGAQDFKNGNAETISGIDVVNDSTLIIKLNEPHSSFIYTLAMPNSSVIAKEAFDKYGTSTTVGTGPFKYTESENELTDLYLVYNENYYMKDSYSNQLPYLDSIHFRFIPSKVAELELFKSKHLSIIYGLPPNKIAQVFSENSANFTNRPPKTYVNQEHELVTQYYEFNSQKEPFNNPLVRKAFNYAVDKKKIIDNTLKGQGAPGDKGITPVVLLFKKYNYSKINGYNYDPAKARKLLAEAGYPNGEGFPVVTLELNLGGNTHLLVAQEIQHQLNAVLNIWIEIEQVSFTDKIEHSKYGKSEMFRSAWVADYPSPETFLSLFYGEAVPSSLDEPSYPNTTRYKNARFDSLFIAGTMMDTEAERFELFSEAEKIMMEDAPVMILWYQENYTLYHSEIRNFHYNAIDYFDFSDVYIKTLTAEEYEKMEAEWANPDNSTVK
ncbi:MAG: ABC transporter substrate-binding protein [Parvicellaceae bacterium]